MKINIEEQYSFTPNREIGRGYTELIALSNGAAIGIARNTIEKSYKLQIFHRNSITYLDLPNELFDDSIDYNLLFCIRNTPIIVTRRLYVIFISEDLRSFKYSNIEDNHKVFNEEELSGKKPFFNLHSGRSINDEILMNLNRRNSQKSNDFIRLSFNIDKQTARWIPIFNRKRNWLKKSSIYRGGLDLEQFPKNRGYPIWGGSPIIYSLLSLDDGYLIYSIGDVRSGRGHSYNCISKISNDLNLQAHLFIEDYHERNDGKDWGRFGVFTSDNSHCILTPKFKKKVEFNWFGKQKVFVLSKNTFEDIELQRNYSNYTILDIKGDDCWLEKWDKVNKIKYVVKGKRK